MRVAFLLTALVGGVGCIEDGPPDPTELVISSVSDRYGDVIVSGGMIRWTDGMFAYEAPLADMPIDGRLAQPLTDTTRNIAVHRDTVYVIDSSGIVSFTNGTEARVVTQAGVDRVMVTDDNTVYWTDSNGVSYFGSDGRQISIGTEAAVIDLVSAGGEVYVTTIGSYSVPPFGQLVTRSKLFHLDAISQSVTEVADGADFADEFIADGHFGAADVYQTGGLHVIEDSLYWSVFLDTMSDHDQRLVERRTASGFERVLEPQPRADEIMVDNGAFYWHVDDVLWRAFPDGAPEPVFADKFFTIAIADHYAYGFVPAISGVGYDLRRLSLRSKHSP